MSKSTNRFGARYGRRTKNNVAKIESQYLVKQKCPYCNKTSVKKLAMGIWNCRSCSAKFAGKAFSVA